MTDYVSGYMMSGNLNVGNVNAASTVVMGSSFLRNRIINGAMVINQRGGNPYTVNSASVYTLDRFEGAVTGSGVFSVTPSATTPNTYFTNSALITVTTAASSYSTNDYYFLQQKIEGYNLYDLGWGAAGAQAVTISFWVRSSISGIYSFHLINASINYSYVATYTIAAPNTWQYVTISVPGPTAGSWNTTNGVGVFAGWDLGSGTGRQTTANTWTSGASFYSGTSSTTQFMSTLSATFYVTGLQIEAGSFATPFERRQFTQELQLCQRYYEKTYNLADAPGTATYSGSQTVAVNTGSRQIGGYFAVRKRSSSTTVTIYAAATGASGNITASAANRAASSVDIGESGFRLQVTGGVAISEDTAMHWVAANEL